MLQKFSKSIYLAAGFLATFLAVIGIALPLLPTTPFAIVAAFCFSKSSPRFHRMLLNNRFLGPTLKAWEEQGSISLKAKITSTVMMYALVSYPLIFIIESNTVRAVVLGTMICVSIYIWTRPNPLPLHQEP
ncbi:MAG: YbaN family protein [Pseudomonadota bacterium]